MDLQVYLKPLHLRKMVIQQCQLFVPSRSRLLVLDRPDQGIIERLLQLWQHLIARNKTRHLVGEETGAVDGNVRMLLETCSSPNLVFCIHALHSLKPLVWRYSGLKYVQLTE